MNSPPKKILINGYFFCRRFTGIERYAYEITSRLDKLCKLDEIAIIVPADAVNIPKYENIRIIRYGKIIQHILWQMIILQWFLITHREYTVLEFGNIALPFAPGIVFLHDIYCEIFHEDFTGFKEKIICLYNRWQYRLIAKKAKKIVTVSEYSKNEISKTFNIEPSKISVIFSSADHVHDIDADNSIFEQFPMLAGKSFYFLLGSLSKRKNLRWILEYAAKHPESIFAISGTSLSTVKVNELDSGIPKNIIILGYLDDSKVKALMMQCKAFILPSYYEGFGLTPLEALSCGAQIVVAKAASLPEIYRDTAHYIEPFDTDIDLDALISEPVEKPDSLFKKYSFDKSAQQVYEIIKNISLLLE
jgi:glycosyltransferase involved in cell wall biosynthesis